MCSDQAVTTMGCWLRGGCCVILMVEKAAMRCPAPVYASSAPPLAARTHGGQSERDTDTGTPATSHPQHTDTSDLCHDLSRMWQGLSSRNCLVWFFLIRIRMKAIHLIHCVCLLSAHSSIIISESLNIQWWFGQWCDVIITAKSWIWCWEYKS